MNANEPTDDARTDAPTETDGGTAAADPAAERMEPGAHGDVPPEAVASLDDFTVERNADGDVLPVYEPLPGREQFVKVLPLRQGDANEYLPASGDPRGLTDEGILALLHEFYLEPDFSGVEDLDEIKAFGLDPLLMALMNASGFDYAQGMVAESNELVEAVQGNTSRGN